MAYRFNPLSGTFDMVDNVEPAFIFKGSITIASNFPTSALVENGWLYTILADVTDNDGTKTNTGQSFLVGDEIAWNGSDWTVMGNENIWTKNGTAISPAVPSDDLDMGSGTGTFGQIIDNGLTANLGVYTNGSKQLTSTPPTSGILGYWNRTGTVLSPSNAGDNITTTGEARAQYLVADSGFDQMVIDAGSITSTTGTIDFQPNDLITTGEARATAYNFTNDTSLTSAFDGSLVLGVGTGTGDAQFTMNNGGGNLSVFRYVNGADHISTIRGASKGWYNFELASDGENPDFRVYGYPTGESLIYGTLKADADNFQITSSSGKIDFDDNTLKTTGTMSNNADNSQHTFGEDGATDSYIQWDGGDLDIYSSGDINLDATDNIYLKGSRIVMNKGGNARFCLDGTQLRYIREYNGVQFHKDAGGSWHFTGAGVKIGSSGVVGAGDLVVDGNIKIADSTLLATPVAGTLEFDNDRMYLTNLGHQRAIDRTSDVMLSTVTVANTTTKTLLWTGEMGANSLSAGNVFKFHGWGVASNTANGILTISVEVGGNEVASLDNTARNFSDDDVHIDAMATQRTIGSSGSRAFHIDLCIGEDCDSVTGVANINTENNMDVEIFATWSAASASNTMSLQQGFMEYKN